MTVRAPAKVNLHLSVGPLRADGFHDLTTVFHAISLCDEVTVTRAPGLTIRVQGESAAEVPTDHSNLAARAVLALADRTGVDPDVEVLVHKGIPVAGGCAGGSADAAATLVACDALWGLGLGRDELAEIGAELGSDVPFSLHGGTALGTGRGERLTPVLGAGQYAWVLALADVGLSTPDVYRELDRQRESGPVAVASDPSEVLAALRLGTPEALGRALSNDLQPAAMAMKPALRKVLDSGDELGALGGVVSGSGPTVAFLARDDGHATALAAALSGHGVCRTVRVADGPVPGARVIRTL
ncbi:MAG: 4-diphosphocytidyl-2-C-methyl-D-erythritol kinase [Frankiales bacterium]|nr:4-diphosphocytidyl-2-C-methyl-D-erythritol kinase [Frankiales bacterium]MCW2586311.1 4-diphosphocytidyl-2-C-methyl-D-erythritol kinase [Frankiales bacterium]